MSKAAVLKTIFAALVFIGGLAVFLYPIVSNFINEQSQTSLISNFDEAVESLSDGDKTKSLEAAHAYNAALVHGQGVIVDPFGEQTTNAEEDDQTLSFLSIGEIMGYVQIPKIGLKAPVYEGTSEEVLQKGIGWLSGTSLPVGGESSNTVLSGHRGLPTSKLFTDIDQLEVGDEFFFKNSIEVLAYKVIETKIIDPNAFEALDIVEGHDRMTLLTCHPYMINTHRLLVIGERIPYEGQLEAIEEEKGLIGSITGAQKDLMIGVLAVAALTGLALLVFLRSRRSRKKERSRND